MKVLLGRLVMALVIIAVIILDLVFGLMMYSPDYDVPLKFGTIFILWFFNIMGIYYLYLLIQSFRTYRMRVILILLLVGLFASSCTTTKSPANRCLYKGTSFKQYITISDKNNPANKSVRQYKSLK